MLAAVITSGTFVKAEMWVDKARREKRDANKYFGQTNITTGFNKQKENRDAGSLRNRLNEVLPGIKGYNYGDEGGRVAELRRAMEGVYGNDELERISEKAFMDFLGQDSSYDAKQLICRQLRKVGGEACVPVVVPMLADPKYSDMARYAIQSISSPAAEKALIDALDKTKGQTKAGIINSLAVRGSAAAFEPVSKLVYDKDVMVSKAAVAALGKIGTKDSGAVLLKFGKKVSSDRKDLVYNAAIRCGYILAKQDKSAAGDLFAKLSGKSMPWNIRTAAIKGQLELKPSGRKLDKIVGNIISLLKSEDAKTSAIGVAAIYVLPESKEVTKKLAGVISKCQPYVAEKVIYAMADRDDGQATSAISAAVESDNTYVRQAALESLGEIGGAASIPLLAKVASSGTAEEKETALQSLRVLKGDNIQDAFINLINVGSAKARADVIYAISKRDDMHKAFGAIYNAAKNDGSPVIRKSAIAALGDIGTGGEIKAMVELIVAPKKASDSKRIEKALFKVFGRVSDRNAQAGPVLEALKNTPDSAKPALLSLLSKPATGDAYRAVKDAVKSGDAKVSDAAIRSLSQWPTAEPSAMLYEIAKTSNNEIHKVLALRGYVRLAELTDDPIKVYRNSMKLATRTDLIRTVLSGLGNADTLEALEMAKGYMDKPGFKNEAAMAAVNISSRYCWADYSGTKALMEKIKADTKSNSVRDSAHRIIDQINRFNGNVFIWKISSLYRENGRNGNDIFNKQFDPETNPGNVQWSEYKIDVDGEDVDLEKVFGNVDNCSVYLLTYINSPVEQDAKFEASADDKIKGWINGQQINDGNHFKLVKGENRFMIKIGDNSGGWKFRCKVKKTDNSRLENISFYTK